MNDIVAAQWCVNAETGERVLIDLNTNTVLLRQVYGVTVPPEPTIRLAIKIADTIDGYRLDIKYPETAHYENPDRYIEALATALRAIEAEIRIEKERLNGDSMEVM